MRNLRFLPLVALALLAAAGCDSGKGSRPSTGMPAPPGAEGSFTQTPAPGPSDSSAATSPAAPDASTPSSTQGGPTPGPANPESPSASVEPGTNEPAVTPSEAAPTSQAYTLRYRPSTTSTYKIRQENEMTIEIPDLANGGKGTKKTVVNQVMDQSLKFANVKDSGFDVTTDVVKAEAKASNPDPMVKNIITQLNAVQGRKVTMSYDSRGRITGGLEKAAQAGLQDLATAIGFQSLSFPEKPVKPGDSWQTKVDLASALKGINPMFGSANQGVEPMPVNTRFLRTEGDVGVFEVKISGAPKLKSDAGGSAMTMSFEMNILSTIRVNLKTGLMESSSGNAVTKVNMAAGPAGNISFGQSIKMNSKRI